MCFSKLKLTIILSFFAFQAFAQGNYTTAKNVKGKMARQWENAMEYNRAEDFDRALKALGDLLKEDPSFIDAHLLRAAILYDRRELPAAEAGFEQALAIDPEYDEIVYYQLALTEMRQKKYEEAAGHFEAFLKREPRSESLRARATAYLADARFAAETLANPVPYEPRRLSDNINTPNAEYLPSLTADEQYLVYTAVVQGQEDFYISEKIDGVWQRGQPLEEVNTFQNEGAQSISADGRLLVFTACNRRAGLGRCDLYFSELQGGRWTKPQNMGQPVNSAAWESLPSLSADGKALYFASDRQGTLGRIDLWVSYRQPDGSWGQPQNLGKNINTPEDDQSPFIHPDGQTLYFMSKGHPGMGGFDLYLSRRQPDGTWGKPQNLGYPINTDANEGAFIVSLDGRTAYFASDRDPATGQPHLDEKGRVTTDIYSFELYPEARPQPVTYVKAQVRDAATGDPLAAKVEFFDLASEQVYASTVTGDDGVFLVCLPLGRDYALNVSRPQYLFHSENFALAGQTTLENPFLLEVELVSIPASLTAAEEDKPKPVVLRNVFFATGSAALLPASRGELDRLAQLLRDNPKIKIQINGHTDNVGSDTDNLTLSENRAKAVYDYLVDKGIPAARLRYKGFGENKPIDTNETEEGRQNNRRTEFEMIQ